MGVLLLGPHMIIVIIGFNERGSQGEMMRRGMISHKWVKVWKCLTPQKNTSKPCYDDTACHMLSVCTESDISVYLAILLCYSANATRKPRVLPKSSGNK